MRGTKPIATQAGVLLLLLLRVAWGREPIRLAILPLDNQSTSAAAGPIVRALLTDALAGRGYTPVPAEAVEDFLRSERIRYLDSLTPAQIGKLCKAVGASRVLLGSVWTVLEGRSQVVGISARMIGSEGKILWWESEGLSRADLEGPFGLTVFASVSEMIPETVGRLVKTLPPAHAEAGASTTRTGSSLRPPTSVYRSKAVDWTRTYRLCLLPVQNRSSNPAATRAMADLLARRFTQTKRFQVVEPAELRAALLAEKITSLHRLDPAALGRLAARLGTKLFPHDHRLSVRRRGGGAGGREPAPRGLPDADRPRVGTGLGGPRTSTGTGKITGGC